MLPALVLLRRRVRIKMLKGQSPSVQDNDWPNTFRNALPVTLPAARRPILRPTRPRFTAITSPIRRVIRRANPTTRSSWAESGLTL